MAFCHDAPAKLYPLWFNRRSLATLREYLTLPPEKLRALSGLIQDGGKAGGLITRAANRFLDKADREAASVLSNAQRHTHVLDSPRIAKATSRSDFHFVDLRHRIRSVFLVLPPNRMDAYSRWLRLLAPQPPALFFLDEFAVWAVLRPWSALWGCRQATASSFGRSSI